MQKEYLSAAAEVLSDQGVDENLGLSNDEASSRLAKTGPNKLEEAEKTPLWKRFFEQMADPMVIMLIVAAVILVCALGFNSVGGIGFTVGSVTINLSGLAVAAIAGILLNAILPGNDYEFDAADGSEAATSSNLQV